MQVLHGSPLRREKEDEEASAKGEGMGARGALDGYDALVLLSACGEERMRALRTRKKRNGEGWSEGDKRNGAYDLRKGTRGSEKSIREKESAYKGRMAGSFENASPDLLLLESKAGQPERR